MQIGTKYIWGNFYFDIIVFTQHTWVLMKASFVFFCLSSEEVFRRLHQDEHIRLSHTSSEDVFKMSWTIQYSSWLYVFKTSSRCFQDVFKTSSRRVKMSFRHPQKVLLRRLQEVLQKRLQDIFKTSCKDVFKTFSSRIIKLNCSC